MVEQTPSRPASQSTEDGYMLLAVVVMVALVLIALSVATPIIAKDIQRQKELESERRSLDYERAIRLYYRKNKGYPPNMDALLKGTNLRYLRRKWIDPLTGKDDWRIIHTPKTKTHFPFGEDIAGGLGGAGLGSASGMASSGGVGTAIGGGTTTVGSGSALGAGFTGASVASPTSGSGSTSTTGNTSTTGGASTPGSSSSSSDSGMFGDSSGGVIYGVATSKSGDSILTPNQQTTYETWEFWYDPQIELFYQKANPVGGGGMGSQSATSMGQDATTGQSNSGATNSNSNSSFGNSSFGNSSFGNSGSSGTNNSPFGNGSPSTTNPQ